MKKGSQHTPESLNKMSGSKRGKYVGKNNPMYGKKRPDVAERNKTQAQRDAVSRYDSTRVISDETKKKIGAKSKEKWVNNRSRYTHILELLRTAYSRIDHNYFMETRLRGEKHPGWKGGISKYRYRGKDWRKQRELRLKTDGYKCVLCGEDYTKGNLDVHHIVRYYYTKDNSLENLITLCKRCHKVTEGGNGIAC